MSSNLSAETINFELLLQAVFERYGYDFRQYARSSIQRRIVHFGREAGFGTHEDLFRSILDDEVVFSDLVSTISVPVTDMFRDPYVFRAIRNDVIPYLATFPYPKIWQAGCASGEEVYSLSILLEEEGLHPRACQYATDLNLNALKLAEKGRYAFKDLGRFESNYQKAAGKKKFADYHEQRFNEIIMHHRLRSQVLFTRHNLVSDQSFGEVHFIMCRNVLIYFNRALQNRVLSLFAESLRPNGYLCLGTRETATTTELKNRFECVDRETRLYVRK